MGRRAVLLLDTHTWAWSLDRDARLSEAARRAMAPGRGLVLSPVSLYEITQKANLGKWPEMEPHLGRLTDLLGRTRVRVAGLTPEVAIRAGLLDWPHRDPFDRIIAATAQVMGLPLVSKDPAFDSVPGGLHRVW